MKGSLGFIVEQSSSHNRIPYDDIIFISYSSNGSSHCSTKSLKLASLYYIMFTL